MYWGPPEFQGFANIAGMMKECWNFLWGVISGGTWAPFNIIFIVQSPKFVKSMFFVTSGTSVIGINYHLCRSGSSGICFWPANRAIVVGFRWFLHHWKALFKVDEGCHTFRGLGTSWHNGNSTCSPPKVEFSIQSLLFPVYSADIDAKNVEEMSNKSELEKIFLLTLVQNAKCYRITRQENPEFLGEFDGGAKTTSNSGVIYREIWERYARYVSSLTNKQTNKQIKQAKWMKYLVIGDQSKEEKIWNLHYIGIYR